MPRPLIAALALFALLLPVGGCYRYDARARNLTGHDIRVSIHKGYRNREVSTAVLGSGASVGWTGSFNGPVLIRVATGAESIDVGLPRRAHTVVEVSDVDGRLSVLKTIGDESWSLTAECPEECAGECEEKPATDAAPAAAEEEGDSEEIIDLVEPGDG